jgi:hypothetical protein
MSEIEVHRLGQGLIIDDVPAVMGCPWPPSVYVPGGVLVRADGSLVLVPDAAVCARWVIREIEADEAEGDEARRVLHREITLLHDGYAESRGFSFGRWMPIDHLPEMTPEILEMLDASNAETKP